ncbi:MAG: molecular chaperone DnaJ [Candidatus Andersenbacteria bacterium]
MAKNYYDILGVERNASDDDIKRAFRKAAHQHHPDKSGGDAEKFKEANEAYQVLSNRDKRQEYDQYGQTFEQARANGQGFPGGGFGGDTGGFPFGAGAQAGTFTQEDLGDLFGDLFGFGRRRSAQPTRRGDDLEVSLTIDFNEAAFGVKKELKVNRLVPCEQCRGTGDKSGKLKDCPTCAGHGRVHEVRQTILGQIAQERTCGTCHGDGQIPTTPCAACSGQGRRRDSETLVIEVPAGINDGQLVRLTGQGDAGRRGGEAGDLLINVRARASKTFVREGADVKTRVDLEYPQLVLGDTVEIQGLLGQLKLSVPAGTEPGSVLTLHGEGATVLGAQRRGDMFVEVGIVTPKRVSPEERSLLERLAEVRGKRVVAKRKRRGLFS